MKSLAAALLMIVTLAAACTAPGEPPNHPNRQDYRDLIRREATDTTSALATAKLVVTYLRQDRITDNYAPTILHQMNADLHRNSRELGQTPTH